MTYSNFIRFSYGILIVPIFFICFSAYNKDPLGVGVNIFVFVLILTNAHSLKKSEEAADIKFKEIEDLEADIARNKEEMRRIDEEMKIYENLQD